MTGYGKAVAQLENGKITVEIRTLNGKNADINLKSSLLPKDKEIEIRRKIASVLVRGTIDVFINWEPDTSDCSHPINKDLVRTYYGELLELRKTLPGFALGSIKETDRMNNELLTAILRLPDVIDNSRKEIITPENWPLVEGAFDRALEALCEYRAVEGKALYRDVTSRIARILDLEDEVEGFEAERIAAVRERISKALEDLSQKPDASRFEQEMIFYLEKLDINEEKVRLRQHCKYFLDTIDSEPEPGRKLGFIIQEMGREINTTGSKANHAGIQKTVVRMKDELEKIREQSMNIL